MTVLLSIIKKFYRYQAERFPIIVLGLSLLPAILSSGAVVVGNVQLKFVLLAVVISIVYLLHVRIIDEFCDYEHDLIHHKERPVPSGVITLRELQTIDFLALLILFLTAFYAGHQVFLWIIAMLIYSHFARGKFFLGIQLRKNFYLYNAVNLIQLVFLQLLVYMLASKVFELTGLIVMHFLFTATGTTIYEFLRKVKTPRHDGTGKDTYTWFLGLNRALKAYSALAILNTILFIGIMRLVPKLAYWPLISMPLIIGTFSTLLMNRFKAEEKTNQLMQLSFMVMYGAFNILIFIAV